MKKAGVEIIHFGIESGNQDVLDYYNKKLALKEIIKTVELSHKMGFLTIGSFILGAPIETEKHIQNTIKFSLSIPLDLVLFFALRYVYGSDIWHEAEKDGKINYKKDGHFLYTDSAKNLGNFTTKEIREYTIKAYNRFYYNPLLWFKFFYRTLKKRDPRWVFIGFKFLLKNLC